MSSVRVPRAIDKYFVSYIETLNVPQGILPMTNFSANRTTPMPLNFTISIRKSRRMVHPSLVAQLFPSMMFYRLVWAFIWITFEVAMLIGFVLIGIASFKRTQDQMYAEAGAYILMAVVLKGINPIL